MCRIRPLNSKEKKRKEDCVFNFEGDSKLILRSSDDLISPQPYTFDRVFSTKANQKEVYKEAAKPLVQSVLEGFNGTIFAYGQTNSGKTFTMQGPEINDDDLRGILRSHTSKGSSQGYSPTFF